MVGGHRKTFLEGGLVTLLQQVHFANDSLGVFQKIITVFGQSDPHIGPDEELDTQFIFQVLDRTGEVGLGHKEFFGGLVKGPATGNDLDIPTLLQIHDSSPPHPFFAIITNGGLKDKKYPYIKNQRPHKFSL